MKTNRATFAEELRHAIVATLRQFREAHPDERPYAFALIVGQPGAWYISSAIATEEGLQEVAETYRDRHGYRFVSGKSERPASLEELKTLLRWANPDDGWYYERLV